MSALLLALAQLLWGFAFVGALTLVAWTVRAVVCRPRPITPGRQPFVPEQRS